MEFDWLEVPFDLRKGTPARDRGNVRGPFQPAPFARTPRPRRRGAILQSRPHDRQPADFSVFWTDGKRYRVILACDMTPEEAMFYDRRNSEFNL